MLLVGFTTKLHEISTSKCHIGLDPGLRIGTRSGRTVPLSHARHLAQAYVRSFLDKMFLAASLSFN